MSLERRQLLTPTSLGGMPIAPYDVRCPQMIPLAPYHPPLSTREKAVISVSHTSVSINPSFRNCEQLLEVELSEGVQEILVGESAFRECKALLRVKLPSTSTLLVIAARECEQLFGVELPEALQLVGDSAFSECLSLARMVIPSSLKAIPTRMFSRCENLEWMGLPGDYWKLEVR